MPPLFKADSATLSLLLTLSSRELSSQEPYQRCRALCAVIPPCGLSVGRRAAIGRGRVAVPVIEPQRAVRTQHATDLRKHGTHGLDMLGERRLQPELAGNAVISQAPIGRARHHAMHALTRQSAEDVAAVTCQHRNSHPRAATRLSAFALARSLRIRSAPVIAFGPSDGRPFSFVTSGSRVAVTGGFVTVTGAESAIPRPVCQSHNHGVRATMRSSARPFLRVESEGCIIGLRALLQSCSLPRMARSHCWATP